MDDILAELDAQVERLGGGWAEYLIRALWDHPFGLTRQQVIDIVLEDALARGRATPYCFASTLDSTFHMHCSGSAKFRASPKHDIFEFVGSKGSGVWGLHRAKALAWMAANGRVCDSILAS